MHRLCGLTKFVQLPQRSSIWFRSAVSEARPVEPLKDVFVVLSQIRKSKRVTSQLREKEYITEEILAASVDVYKKQLADGMSEIESLPIKSSRDELKTALVDRLVNVSKSLFPAEIRDFRELSSVTDLRLPHTWYPAARRMKRKIVYHMGPTNSGKTHSALERFRSATTGVYCGPLRLLALEIFDRVNDQGVPCSLVTGEEQREVDKAQHTACTIEMASLVAPVDVAVIDEIQMIGDEQRGWAWTRALLGLQAKEIHLCGDATALTVVKRLLSATGDSLEVKTYERLTPLKPLKHSLDDSLSNIRKGDCLIAFGRKKIYSLKRMIEMSTKFKCCVVYGRLPPEARAKQAALFNAANSGFDVLVASDAVGMGLNLNIRRVVFESLEKFDGNSVRLVYPTQVKQIAGRAGRYRSLFPEGEVTCVSEDDMFYLHKALAKPPVQLQSAGLAPMIETLGLYANRVSETRLSAILQTFSDLAKIDGHYFICNQDDQKRLADLIQPLELSLRDRFLLCEAPVAQRDETVMAAFWSFAKQYSEGAQVHLQFNPPNRVPVTAGGLSHLESIHLVIDLYLWLSYRFEEHFPDREAALVARSACASIIQEGLVLQSSQWRGKRWQKRARNLGLETREEFVEQERLGESLLLNGKDLSVIEMPKQRHGSHTGRGRFRKQ